MATATAISEEAQMPVQRRLGVITSWGGRGFGFIASGREKFFFHVREAYFAPDLVGVGLKVFFEPDYNVPDGDTPRALKVSLSRIQINHKKQ